MSDPLFISVVSPVYRASGIVPVLVEKIKNELYDIANNFEIILVEDGSPDNSWESIVEVCKKNKEVIGIKLSRNFGQHCAVTAGIKQAKGSIIILMDCDLQDDPAHIVRLIEKHKEGFDIVFSKRLKRKHSFLKSLAAKLYNFCFYLFADSSYDVNVGSLTLFTKRVKIEFLRLKEKDRLYIQMLKWVGFRSAYVEVEHRDRISGASTYTFSKLFSLALQGWTSHSVKLLRFSTYFGFGLAAFAFLAGLAIIFLKIMYDFQAGWASVIVTVLFSTGLIQISIGILGIYLGKTFEQSKDRPLYIIEEVINER